MQINQVTNMNINNFVVSKPVKPSFKSTFDIDAGSAVSRRQIFTLGRLMSMFWMYNPKYTGDKLKSSNCYGIHRIQFKDYQDNLIEKILKENSIKYTKVN